MGSDSSSETLRKYNNVTDIETFLYLVNKLMTPEEYDMDSNTEECLISNMEDKDNGG